MTDRRKRRRAEGARRGVLALAGRAPDSALAAALAVAAGSAVFLAVASGVGSAVAIRTTDVLWPDGELPPEVRVVAVDDRSIAEHGPWPWAPDLQARLVAAVLDAGAAVTAYDVVVVESEGEYAALRDALDRPGVLSARSFASVRASGRWLTGTGEAGPGGAGGHAVVTADRDGVVRRLPLVVENEAGDLVPALPVAAVDALDGGIEPLVVAASSLRFGQRSVPTEGAGQMRIHWAGGTGEGDPSILSAADVLAGRGGPELVDAVVFVGVTAAGLGDRHVTPLRGGAVTPGVVVHAEAADTILRGLWVTPPPALPVAALTAILALPAAYVALRRRLRWALLVAVASVGAVLALGVVLFGVLGILPDLVRAPIAIGAAGVFALLVRVLRETRERRRAERLFSRYVPAEVARQLLEEGRLDSTVEGERLTVAVVFCDLRSFTPLAARLEPRQVRQVLDAFYDYACARIFVHGGTVMQFVGDEVFAVFGAPLLLADPVAPARAAAFDLQRERGVLEATLLAAGLPAVGFGIGLHAGPVVAAHVGTDVRRQYAVVGDTVNVGSRLCGVASAGQIVASPAAGGAGDWSDASAEEVTVKGKDEPLSIARVVVRAGEPADPPPRIAGSEAPSPPAGRSG
ncbi:MAG: Adenylate cyclase [Naasia sp.]|nr:Adenylate cyclase [Naasia sp.]